MLHTVFMHTQTHRSHVWKHNVNPSTRGGRGLEALGMGPRSLPGTHRAQSAGAPQGTELRPGGGRLASKKQVGGKRRLKRSRALSGPGSRQIHKSESPFFPSQSSLLPSAFCLIHLPRELWAASWILRSQRLKQSSLPKRNESLCPLKDLYMTVPSSQLPKSWSTGEGINKW